MSTTDNTLSIRTNGANPNHHLWNNNGTWWLHYTLHRGAEKHRVRRSLGTALLDEARARRDAILKGTASLPALLVA